MRLYLSILVFLSVLCFQAINAQTEWYFGLQTGAKISFSSSESGEDIYDVDNGYTPHIIARYSHTVALALQYGLKVGYHFKDSPFKIESGLSIGGHVLNFTPVLDSKGYWGDKLKSKLTYYLIELPVSVEYMLPCKMKSTRIGAFLGGKANFLEFRPYWGESSPWNKHHDGNEPLIQTAYFVPKSETAERRYIKAYKNYPEFLAPTFSITGGCSVYFPLGKATDLRITASYTHGLRQHLSEGIEVMSMNHDDFGVLVLSRPQESYYATSKTSNAAIDLTLLFKVFAIDLFEVN